MTSSAQYSALTRLLTHNTRVHQLEDLLLQLPMPPEAAAVSDVARSVRFDYEYEYECEQDNDSNPIADLQDDIDKEVRASLVACWFAMPRNLDDLEEA
jgi:hypothetical protein